MIIFYIFIRTLQILTAILYLHIETKCKHGNVQWNWVMCVVCRLLHRATYCIHNKVTPSCSHDMKLLNAVPHTYIHTKIYIKQHWLSCNNRILGLATRHTHFKHSNKRTGELTTRHSHLKVGYIQMLQDVPCCNRSSRKCFSSYGKLHLN